MEKRKEQNGLSNLITVRKALKLFKIIRSIRLKEILPLRQVNPFAHVEVGVEEVTELELETVQ